MRKKGYFDLGLHNLIMQYLLGGSPEKDSISQGFRQCEVSKFLTLWLKRSWTRQRVGQVMHDLVRRGLVDFVYIKNNVRGSEIQKGTKFFSLTPKGVLRMGVSNDENT